MKHLLLDLDGVIADLHRPLLALYGNLHRYTDITYWNFFDDKYPDWRVATANPTFWATLPQTPEFHSLVTGIQNIVKHPECLYICTSPTGASGCIDGKIAWVERNLGRQAVKNVIISVNKGVSSRGNVLIDDSDHNCAEAVKNGGTGLLVPRPWNGSRISCFKDGTFDVFNLLESLRMTWES